MRQVRPLSAISVCDFCRRHRYPRLVSDDTRDAAALVQHDYANQSMEIQFVDLERA